MIHRREADRCLRGTGRASSRRRLVAAALGVGVLTVLAGCGDDDTPAQAAAAGTRATTASTGPAPAGCAGPDDVRRPLDGFGEVGFRVDGRDGSTSAGCALLAADPEARAQGLMGQRDLRGYDAMVFRYERPTTGGFYMFDTVLPLSIAFIGADGAVVSSTDMDPCQEEVAAACPTIKAEGPYLHAVEVAQGGLRDIGIVPGAVVTFGDGAP